MEIHKFVTIFFWIDFVLHAKPHCTIYRNEILWTWLRAVTVHCRSAGPGAIFHDNLSRLVQLFRVLFVWWSSTWQSSSRSEPEKGNHTRVELIRKDWNLRMNDDSGWRWRPTLCEPMFRKIILQTLFVAVCHEAVCFQFARSDLLFGVCMFKFFGKTASAGAEFFDYKGIALRIVVHSKACGVCIHWCRAHQRASSISCTYLTWLCAEMKVAFRLDEDGLLPMSMFDARKRLPSLGHPCEHEHIWHCHCAL